MDRIAPGHSNLSSPANASTMPESKQQGRLKAAASASKSGSFSSDYGSSTVRSSAPFTPTGSASHSPQHIPCQSMESISSPPSTSNPPSSGFSCSIGALQKRQPTAETKVNAN
ncbi:hypothetical protein Nepgr_003833 [Nepenthes gracilis]|uniref:Uncharacterized protein n=1 Tax=Nepenthes gracilis TaxID=150966 RepID=A0AAD3XE81_NEPGR|nr:hypothetical protein Nepgr_003833 [Nepenthes gracilis]